MQSFFRELTKSNVRLFTLLAVLVLTAYSFMLASPFKTLDDDFSIVKNAEIRDLGRIPHYFLSTYFKGTQDYYRPTVYVTYALEYHFFGLNYFYYNLDNVLLHVLNAWLVFVLAGLLFSGTRGTETVSAGQTIGRSPGRAEALAVAFLYAIHPLHWEAVGNVSGRAILLCAFFVLSGLIFFLKFRREKKMIFLGGMILCYMLGLASKESAGVLILTAAAYIVLIERPRNAREALDIRTWGWILPFPVIVAAYLALRHALGIAKMFPWPSKHIMVLGIVSFLKGILIYIGLFFFPVGLRFDRGLPIFVGFNDPYFWLTIAVWGVIVGTVWRFRRELTGLPLFCLAWFLIELIPVSQIVTTIGVYPGAISLAEHFVYVAIVPALILMVLLARQVLIVADERKIVSARVMRGAFAGVFLFFYLMLVQQNIYATNEFVMLRDSLAKDPQNARLQYSMAMLYVNARNFDKAVEHLREAVRVHGCNYSYHIALGKALMDQGDLLGAAREYESIPPRKDINPLLEGNKKALYRQLVVEYEKKVATDPADSRTHFALGIFYAKRGEDRRALEQFSLASQLKPDYYDALYNVAVTSEAVGEKSEARAAWEKLGAADDPQNTYRTRAQEALRGGK